jgi:hypothetical protein
MGCLSSTNSSSTKDKKGTPVIKAGVAQLRQMYNINPKILGSGSFGKVF